MRWLERIGRISLLGVMTPVLLLLIGHMPALASEQASFEATCSGPIAFTGQTTLEYSGSGVARHLGSSSISGHIDILGPGLSPGGYRIEEHASIRAANGDQIVLVLEEQSSPVAPGVFHGIGTYRITGGTGRFNGATGRGIVDGRGDFDQDTFKLTCSGTISRISGER
jgi:hypothetical protein